MTDPFDGASAPPEEARPEPAAAPEPATPEPAPKRPKRPASKTAAKKPKPAAKDEAAAEAPPQTFDAMGNKITVEAPAPVTAAAAATEPPPPKRGHATVVYRGRATVLEVHGIEFRPGVAVNVPNDIAEEILTNPDETFEEVKETGDGNPS
jgi:hypothetical protein